LVETLSFLKQRTLFGLLSDAALGDLAHSAGQRRLERGEVLGVAGAPCEWVYFAMRGRIRATKMSPAGREQVINEIWPPEPFYLVPALDGGPLPVSTQAATRATVLVLASRDMLSLLDRHPVLACALATLLAHRLRKISELVGELSLQTVPERLAKFLLDIARSTPPHRLTQYEMAVHLGTVREVVSRTLSDFQTRGWLRVDRGRIEILDSDAMRALAER